MANVIFIKEIKTLAKRANERIRRLERKEPNSPALNKVQARLQMMGKRSDKARGRRFSESGKGTRNELKQLEKELKNFLNMSTSTVKGYREYRKKVFDTANERYDLEGNGINFDDYMKIWETLPDSEKDRMYGSESVIKMVISATKKNGKVEDENELTIEEIIEIIQSSKSLSEAYKSLGITYKEANNLWW